MIQLHREAIANTGKCYRALNTPGMRFFDGYADHESVLIDDFEPKNCPFRWLLQLLDIYPLDVEVKGGSTRWIPKKIYITHEKHPREWYAGQGDVRQLLRRITEIRAFKDDQTYDVDGTNWRDLDASGYLDMTRATAVAANFVVPPANPSRQVGI